MNVTVLRPFVVFVLSLLCSFPLLAQLASTNAKVNLRRDPSTSSPVIAHLVKGERLVLVDANPDSGFYHVRTEADQVGWIAVKYVTVSPQPPLAPPPTPVTPSSPATGCDASLEAHVYHPTRLIVKQECIAITGTMVDATANESTRESDGVRHEADGDSHGWLKPDAQFENLLNAGNTNAEGGNMVFEIICRYPITQADAVSACQGYTDHVTLPPVGSHVRLLGRYVQDTFHAQWNEIHPVTSITVIQ